MLVRQEYFLKNIGFQRYLNICSFLIQSRKFSDLLIDICCGNLTKPYESHKNYYSWVVKSVCNMGPGGGGGGGEGSWLNVFKQFSQTTDRMTSLLERNRADELVGREWVHFLIETFCHVDIIFEVFQSHLTTGTCAGRGRGCL